MSDPNWLERAFAALTFWEDRADRIDRMRDLIDSGSYDTIISENFTIITDDNTSNWTSLLTRDDAVDLAKGALRELFNTKTGHRILINIASQGRRQNVILNTNGTNTGSFDRAEIWIDISGNPRTTLGSHDINTPLSVLFAHELGHSVLNYDDLRVDPDAILSRRNRQIRYGFLVSPLSDLERTEMLSMGDNVRYVENAARYDLGQPRRESYVSRANIVEYFPEILPRN